MFMEMKKIKTQYTRISNLGTAHTYMRNKTVAVFKCDCCQTIFERDKGNLDHRRMSNEFFHVCSNCNQKKFAQSRSVERRTLWNTSVDSDKDISRI